MLTAAAALTPLPADYWGTAPSLGQPLALPSKACGGPICHSQLFQGDGCPRQQVSGIRHSGTLRPASEMGLVKAEGRRRGLKVFFFLPRELAFGGISVASIDIASSRHVSAPCEHGLVPVGEGFKSSLKEKKTICRHGSFMSNSCMPLEDTLV